MLTTQPPHLVVAVVGFVEEGKDVGRLRRRVRKVWLMRRMDREGFIRGGLQICGFSLSFNNDSKQMSLQNKLCVNSLLN